MNYLLNVSIQKMIKPLNVKLQSLAFLVLRSHCTIQNEYVVTTKVWKLFLYISLSYSFNEAILLITTPYHDLHSKETPIDYCLNDHGLNIESLVGSSVDIFIIHIFKLFKYSYDYGCSFSSFFQACMVTESRVPFQLKLWTFPTPQINRSLDQLKNCLIQELAFENREDCQFKSQKTKLRGKSHKKTH